MRDKIVLSKRLKALASMVTEGNRVCDVGCDHAFVPIYLVNQGISPYVLAMDVRKGPLEQAAEHIREYGLEAYIDTRLSDGLDLFNIGEADSLICAGMGGRLMMNILNKDSVKTASFGELILQPQSELQQFRRFLRSHGYIISDENMIEEGGKFYSIIKVTQKAEETLIQGESFAELWRQQMEDRYGPVLLCNRPQVLINYLNKEKDIYEEILSKLKLQDMSKPEHIKRFEEVSQKLDDCMKVLKEETGGYGNG